MRSWLLIGLFTFFCGPPCTHALPFQDHQAPQITGDARQAEEFQKDRSLAKEYLNHEQASQAIPFLEKARSINGSDFANEYDLSQAYLLSGQLQKARAEASRLLTIRDNADVHTLLGDIETAAHSGEAAAAQYQIAAQMDPSEEHVFDFGQSLLGFGFESDAAIRIFSFGVEKYPKSVRLRIGLGAAYDIHGESDKAVQELCQAADMAPADPQPIDFLGKVPNVSPEMSKQVNQRLSRFLKTHPESASANYYVAHNLLDLWSREPSQDDLITGERLLRTAIRLDPKMTDAYFELGRLLEMKGRLNEAALAYEQAVKLDPARELYHYRLSYVYRVIGQPQRAKKELEAFQRLQSTQHAGDTEEMDRRSH